MAEKMRRNKEHTLNAVYHDGTVERNDKGKVVKGKIFQVTDVATAFVFIGKFNSISERPRAGYDFYFNQGGPTNPDSPRKIGNQGAVKNILVFTNALLERSSSPGPVGNEALEALQMLADEVLPAMIEKAKANREQATKDMLAKLPEDQRQAVIASLQNIQTVVPASALHESDVDEEEEVPTHSDGGTVEVEAKA